MSDIRKKWLKSFKIYAGFSLLEAILACLVDWSAGLISILILCLHSWLFLHFSYKKRGTQLLLWALLSIPASYARQLTNGEYNDLFSYQSFSLEALIVWSMFLAGLIVTIYFWINCLNYREENKEIRKIPSPDKTCQEFSQLSDEAKEVRQENYEIEL